MNKNNILNEKITLGSVLAYLKSKTFDKLTKAEKDPSVQKQLAKLNIAVDDLEKFLRKKGRPVKLPRYTVSSFLQGNKDK